MKKICLIFIFLFCAAGVKAQTICPLNMVCITQAAADSIAHDLDELKASRVVIADFAKERTTTAAERVASQNLVKALNDFADARGKMIEDSKALIALQQSVIQMYGDLVNKMTIAMNKKQSNFQKVLATVEKILLVAVGVSIGRGGL